MEKLSKKEKSRLKIMHEAKRLFEEYGIDGITFNQIAQEADVCRTTVFNHFSSSRDLMLAITTQEIDEIKEFCEEKQYIGKERIYALFDKLIEDTVYYPMLATRLVNNAVLNHDDNNPIKIVEGIIIEGLIEAGSSKEESQDIAILIEGAYFGLINHYHINNKQFDAKTMKKDLHRLLGILIGK